MDITRRCDYACRILRAAYRNGDERMSVAELAEREGIPYAFARSIQHDLTKCGFVNTTRGARGGLRLGCDPATVTVRDVVEAVQGPVSVSECGAGSAPCGQSDTCAYNKVWRGGRSHLKRLPGVHHAEGPLRDGRRASESARGARRLRRRLQRLRGPHQPRPD